MSGRGQIRRVFPGGNTCNGFFSFYEYILPQEDASRIFILKGGPGTGKSTFMNKIGEDMLKLGLDVEYHQCSSDNDSLDGILIPAIKVAIIDGTAPHVVDPKTPGAIDEIINLGEYWDESRIGTARDKIINAVKKSSKLYKTAYSLLKEAKVAYDEWKSYIWDSMDISEYNQILRGLCQSVFEGVPDNLGTAPYRRHLFASAITPGGLKNYVNTLVDPKMKTYALEGEPGSGVKEMIEHIARTAYEKGLLTEQFHCPFEPEHLDMVIIPGINTVVLNTSAPLHYNLVKAEGLEIGRKINLNTCIKRELLDDYKPEFEDAKKRFYTLMAASIEHLANAKAVHDDIEKFYVPAMNFTKIEEKRLEITKKILKYAENKL